ncbi:hypothetical protein PGB90_009671 [Kerria lacca]
MYGWFSWFSYPEVSSPSICICRSNDGVKIFCSSFGDNKFSVRADGNISAEDEYKYCFLVSWAFCLASKSSFGDNSIFKDDSEIFLEYLIFSCEIIFCFMQDANACSFSFGDKSSVSHGVEAGRELSLSFEDVSLTTCSTDDINV